MCVMSIRHNDALSKILQQKDERGYLNRRDSSTIEFKENLAKLLCQSMQKLWLHLLTI